MRNSDELPEYIHGLQHLISELGKNNTLYYSCCEYQKKLLNNHKRASQHGLSNEIILERIKTLNELNQYLIKNIGISLDQYCKISPANDRISKDIKQNDLDSEPTNQPRWKLDSKIAKPSDRTFKEILSLDSKQDYDEAKHRYWELIYYIGTREKWRECSLLANHLLRLSSKQKDYKTHGLVIVTGFVWPLISTNQLHSAKIALTNSLKYLQKDGHASSISTFYEYMADIEEASGNLRKAVELYREALWRTNDSTNAHKINLKMQFAEVKADNIASKSRVIALQLLHSEFKHINSHREALALIELARSLYALESVEALEIAHKAFTLLDEEIKMPTNVKKAKNLVNSIINNEPLLKTKSPGGQMDDFDLVVYIALTEEFLIAYEAFGIEFRPFEIDELALTAFEAAIELEAPFSSFKMLLVPAGKMGNTRASNVMSAILQKYKIRNIAVLGIAGSIDADLQPGDVFIPESVHEYMANSAGIGDDQFELTPSGNRLPIDPLLLNRLQMFPVSRKKNYNEWDLLSKQHWDRFISKDIRENLNNCGIHLRESSNVIVGDDGILASGPAVAKGQAFIHWIKKSVRKSKAIEMESAGVLDAAFIRTPAPQAVVIRGISDYGDHRKATIENLSDNNFRKVAIYNMTTYLMSAVRAGSFS